MTGQVAARWLLHSCGLAAPETQVSDAERSALRRHAAGRRRLVEIGVMQGATTALLRSVMDPVGELTGIDPHPAGRVNLNFDRLIALSELRRHRRGQAVLLRCTSEEAARSWATPIDFLFIDGDHSWTGIARDWNGWSGHVEAGGVIAVHDSRSYPGRPLLESARFFDDVIRKDERFQIIDCVETLVVLLRL